MKKSIKPFKNHKDWLQAVRKDLEKKNIEFISEKEINKMTERRARIIKEYLVDKSLVIP